jgi:protein-tyrosine phosphatase
MKRIPLVNLERVQALAAEEHQRFATDKTYCPNSSSRQLSSICPHLFLSDWDGSTNIASLVQHRIKAVLCVNHELQIEEKTLNQYDRVGIESLYVDALDVSICKISEHFESTYTFISKRIEQGHNVLVHCAQGVNRSPTIVIHFLMRHLYETDTKAREYAMSEQWQQRSLTDLVYQYVECKRYAISPMYTFVHQIQDAERKIVESLRSSG